MISITGPAAGRPGELGQPEALGVGEQTLAMGGDLGGEVMVREHASTLVLRALPPHRTITSSWPGRPLTAVRQRG
ncbi:hypothetical protein [Pseudonocardia acidicola]|uniref:Uncharacterized protein n=1 Tax=Pseudonocardia acidicola TaxID=2724939 RepID=A0ABX1SKN5_9PSEU|nr:hypothetical protein [Pseudonocardia acidicola]NMI00952.1 hypothetical protein [Pseudonocardia acidicola]